MKYTAIIGETTYEVEIRANNSVMVNGEPHSVDFRGIDGQELYSLLIDNRSWEVLVERNGDEFRISMDGEFYVATVEDERTRKIEKGLGKVSAPSGEVMVKAPMPGLVRGVSVQSGDDVNVGQGLIILEAMKMENELRAPRAGLIKEIRVKAGDKVEQGQPLVVIK